LIRFALLLGLEIVGVTYAARSLGAELNLYMATRHAQDSAVALAHLQRAYDLAWFDHKTRGAYAQFFVRFRFYELRREAIAAIERELTFNPFAADLLAPLAAYKLADGDTDGARAVAGRLRTLRPQARLEWD
jgi:hypothetical protein